MEFKDVINNRYSCKNFDGRKVERAALQEILEAARKAPTAKNLQEYHLYVIESEEGLAKIDRCTPCRYHAGTVIMVTYDSTNVFVYPGDKRDSGIEDATIVATHLMLAAADQQVDSCWINYFDPQELAEVMELPKQEEVLMLLDLGYHAQGTGPLPSHSERRSLRETVTYL